MKTSKSATTCKTYFPALALTTWVLLVLGGCANRLPSSKVDAGANASIKRVENPHFSAISEAASAAEKDRLAILALRGEYQVRFHFMETVALRAGYIAKPSKDSDALEAVLVVEVSPNKIVLQHLLLVPGGQVIKHWREDWLYEAKQRFEFVAEQSWRSMPIKPELVTGHWTQCVYEVSDAPLYCGTGKFNHKYGVATWTSDRTWRPLPRRDYTVRDDYNALNVENRITITPDGWTHEQDNTKTLRSGPNTQSTLVREFGLNHYHSVQGVDFSKAYQQWDQTQGFWAKVRAIWATRLDLGGVDLIAGVRDTKLMEALETLSKKQPAAPDEAIERTLTHHLQALPRNSDILQSEPSNGK